MANCVEERQRRLRYEAEPKDSDDRNAGGCRQVETRIMRASVDTMAPTEFGGNERTRISSVRTAARDDEDKCRHDDAVEKMALRDVAN